MQAHIVYTPLRRRVDFSRVHTQGRRKGDTLLQVRVLHRPMPGGDTGCIRLGILVSKKFGNAVARNRFKRIIRAAIRELGLALTPGWDVLVLPRATHSAKMPAVLASLQSLLQALGVLDDAERAPEERGAAS